MPDIDVLLALIVTVLTPAVGWLVSAVIAHGKQIAGLEATLSCVATRTDLQKLQDTIRRATGDMAVNIETLRGDVRALHERTDSVRLVVDRHERYLEQERHS